MIIDIKHNIDKEIELLREILGYSAHLASATNPRDRKLLFDTIDSLRKNMRAMNDSLPLLVGEISLDTSVQSSSREDLSLRRSSPKTDSQPALRVSTRQKEALLKELNIRAGDIKRLRRQNRRKIIEKPQFKSARGYVKLSNKLFWDYAIKWIERGYFKNLSKDIQRSNIDVLFQSYVAMMFMTVFISILASFFIMVFFFFFSFHLSRPVITPYSGNYLVHFAQVLWIPVALPFLTFLALYYYPFTEKQSIAKKINQELPFAVIHMSAISGSGIAPAEIFRIIGLSREYPHLRKEVRKVLNQLNLYGYDLVTALNNTAASTSSTKLSELFTGLATTISSGGDFSGFFQKRAETLLNDYRIERQKYSKTAETFMDIYISVVIAAPMILMLLLIILTIGNFNIGLTTGQLTLLIIASITVINTFFLTFIHINQPTY